MAMTLSEVVYGPLKEEESYRGWNKSTIEYVTDNQSRIIKIIRCMCYKCTNRVHQQDVEDIYSDLIHYLYNAKDYDIKIAIERSKIPGVVVDVEGYVNNCIKNTVKRFYEDKRKIDEKEQLDVIIVNGKDRDSEISLFDTEPQDSDYEYIEYDLENICKQCESKRYAVGADVFMIWFIKLSLISREISSSYRNILEVLGVSKSQLLKIQEAIVSDSVMCDIAKAVSIAGIEKSIEVIRKYTYATDIIENVIGSCA